MKKRKLNIVYVLIFLFLVGCDTNDQIGDRTEVSKDFSLESVTSSSEEKTNTQFEVGKDLFSINIPDFNVMPEGDIADENGNTWLILQSEKYDNLMLQLKLHNKASTVIPDAYSVEDFGIEIDKSNKVNYHNFKNEELKDLTDLDGKIYTFDTGSIDGEIIFLSDEPLTSEEQVFFENMVKSLTVETIK